MTGDAENYLGYIKDGDEAKRDAYVSKFDASEQESIKQGLEQQRRDYERFPADYKDAPDKKLTPEQLNLLGKIKELEEKSELWEKTKEKATKMLWWDDVAKGLAKQKQQTEQSDAETKKEQSADASSKQTQTSSTLATLSQNGRVWFIHPVAMVDYFNIKKSCWHEPLEYPQRTCYSSNTFLNKWNGAFGFVRNQRAKAHTGLDLFADINTPMLCVFRWRNSPIWSRRWVWKCISNKS